MSKTKFDINDEYTSYLKDTPEHGYEEYTENQVKQRVIISFGKSCGCGGSGSGNCACKSKKSEK